MTWAAVTRHVTVVLAMVESPQLGNQPPPYREVEDYNELREGEYDPETGKRIDYIILQDTNYIVYLDTDLYIWWSQNTDSPSGSGAVLNRVAALQAIGLEHLPRSEERRCRVLIGEAVARVVGDGDVKSAREQLDEAEHWISERRSEVARRWYLQASSAMTAPMVGLAIVLWIYRGAVAESMGRVFFDVSLGACAGAAGAWLSVIARIAKTELDVAAGRSSYWYEGVSKIIVGALGAVLVVLAVKANVILGILNASGVGRPIVVLLAMVSGISERIVPTLVSSVERNMALSDSRGDQRGGTEDPAGEPADTKPASGTGGG